MRHTAIVHLLVVEDDDGIAVPLVEGLRLAGFDVTRVSTGMSALGAVLEPRTGQVRRVPVEPWAGLDGHYLRISTRFVSGRRMPTLSDCGCPRPDANPAP